MSSQRQRPDHANRSCAAQIGHLVGVLAALLASTTSVHAWPAQANQSTETAVRAKRLTVAFLWLEDKTGDPNLAHWRYGSGFLDSALGKTKTLRPLSSGAVDYAYQKMELQAGDLVDLNLARRMGQEIEAQRIVWGSYQKIADRWRVDLRVLNVATGAVSPALSAVASEWHDVRDALVSQLLDELRVTPTADEQKEMASRRTHSPEALDWFVQTYWSQDQGEPVAQQESLLRKAIAADPNFAHAHASLAATLLNQGKLDSAEEAVQKALQLKPDSAFAHATLGVIHTSQRQWDQAVVAMERACQLEPEDAVYLRSLAAIHNVRKRPDKAIVLLERASSLDRTDAQTHAHLAGAYTSRKQPEEALSALARARLYLPDNVHALPSLWAMGIAYEALSRRPEALDCFERAMALAKERAIDPATIQSFDKRIQRVKNKLEPAFIDASIPRRYPPEAIEAILRYELTEEERRLIGDPFLCTEPMKQWARDLTRDAKTDLDKARAIFDGLVVRASLTGQPKARTAREVFAAWEDEDVSLVCVDHAVLFIALAKVVGLDAFFVDVTRGPDGDVISHACAAVFLQDRALLVDSSWRWFGVPHQEYAILDDLQATSHLGFTNRLGDPQALTTCRAALKLWPDCLEARLCFLAALRRAGHVEQAYRMFADLDEPSSTDCEAASYWYFRSGVAAHRHEWGEAETCLLKALSLRSDWSGAHFGLGIVYQQTGRLAEARTAFRTYLRGNHLDPEQIEEAREAIAQINEQIGVDVESEAVH